LTKQRALTAVLLLECVLSRELTSIVALHEWPDIDSERDELLSASWHDLSHYAADLDIRARDPRYASTRLSCWRGALKRLERGFRSTKT
jgi:hypothetical protein